MNILIVGDGGIGSNLSLPLIKLITYLRKKNKDEAELIIKIIDGDKIELKNVIRQSFILGDCGDFKTDTTAEHLNHVVEELGAKKISIESLPVYLKEDNIDLIEEGSFVFVGVDNYITRRIIEQKTEKMDEVFVAFGGNEYDDGDVNIILKENGKYITPLYSEKHPEILEKDRFPDEISCEEAAVSAPQLILANQQVAGFMLEAFHSSLTGDLKWHEKIFDLKTGNVRTCQI